MHRLLFHGDKRVSEEMTDAITRSYKCKVCYTNVEYTYPLVKIWIDNEEWSISKSRKYFLAVARYNHNMRHIGELDKI